MGNLYIDDADSLARGLVVVKAAEIVAVDERVSLAISVTPGLEYGMDRCASRLDVRGKDLEVDLLLFSPTGETDWHLRRLRAPSGGQVQPQITLRRAREIAGYADSNVGRFAVMG